MTQLTLTGRILFLSTDPTIITAQLAGSDLVLSQAGKLRDDISTDEITPMPVLVHYDEKLAAYPYVGLKVGDSLPIGRNAVRSADFSVTVAGKNYGKGSSREHSPVAERAAGIQLVIAESFARIYRQNADNVGLFTSTDFSLIERIQRGESIDIAEIVGSRDTLAAAILRCGGLLRYGQQRMRSVSALAPSLDSHQPKTLFEKILARHAIKTDDVDGALQHGSGAFVRADWRFIVDYYTGMCAHMLHSSFGTPLVLHQPEAIVTFEDHLSYAERSPMHATNGLLPDLRGLSIAHRTFVKDYGLRSHGHLQDDWAHGAEGISHPIMTETYALPGQVLVGTDSHTPHSGSLGCVAFGVGTTDMANAFVTGAVRITVPQVMRVELTGPIPAGVTAKDIVLYLLAHQDIKAGVAAGRVFEFGGSAVTLMSTDERATLTNMTAELGGFTGIVAPDAETVRFLRERRDVEFIIEPWMCSDPGANYAHVITVNCAKLTPMVALPGDPGNGIPLHQLSDRVEVDIAYGGSCTAGKREDFDHYHAVLSWAAKHDLRVADGVKLYLQFGTIAVRDYCMAQGYMAAFEAVGAEILQPSCGSCANCGPGASTASDQITVSAINRNFPGRSGPGQVWLASPPTVVASAIAGELISFEELCQRYTHQTASA